MDNIIKSGKTVVFKHYYNRSSGVWYFTPSNGEFANGQPCNGFGAVAYGEGSVYVGELYYDGQNFNQIGFGEQDFSRSFFGKTYVHSGLRRSMYVGNFDYRKTGWIHGNGVMYYVDEDGNPLYFMKGFFSALEKVGDYVGNFDYDQLAQGYTVDMEIQQEKTDNVGNWLRCKTELCRTEQVDVLFVGDSYFEFGDYCMYAGKNLFSKVFSQTHVNVGVSGSAFAEWIDWIDNVSDIVAPRKIVVNLGFNDLHRAHTVEKVYDDLLAFLTKLRKYFPSSEIYLLQVVPSPFYAEFLATERAFNDMVAERAASLHVRLIDWRNDIAASAENCYHEDGVHPNEHGYELMEKAILRFL